MVMVMVRMTVTAGLQSRRITKHDADARSVSSRRSRMDKTHHEMFAKSQSQLVALAAIRGANRAAQKGGEVHSPPALFREADDNPRMHIKDWTVQYIFNMAIFMKNVSKAVLNGR
jgi:hypothetical protein